MKLDDSVTKKALLDIINKGGDMDDFRELESNETEELIEFAENVPLVDGGGCATVQLCEDNERCLWDNRDGIVEHDGIAIDFLDKEEVKEEFYGARLRTLIECGISSALMDTKIDLSLYANRQLLIDKIEERLEGTEFNAICTSNGTTFEKSFTPTKK